MFRNSLSRCSIEHHVGHALTILDTHGLMEHRAVEACIRKNDAAPGRRPSFGHCQTRLRPPVSVDLRIDENDDAGGYRVTATQGRFELPWQTPSGRIQRLPSLIFWIHPYVLDMTITRPHESLIDEKNDPEAATRLTAQSNPRSGRGPLGFQPRGMPPPLEYTSIGVSMSGTAMKMMAIARTEA